MDIRIVATRARTTMTAFELILIALALASRGVIAEPCGVDEKARTVVSMKGVQINSL